MIPVSRWLLAAVSDDVCPGGWCECEKLFVKFWITFQTGKAELRGVAKTVFCVNARQQFA